MKKILLIAGLVTAAMVVIVIGWFWYSMQKPLYEPGMVRSGEKLRAPLTPPEQTGDGDFWQVEPDIQLQHFSQGQGHNVLIVHGGPGSPPSNPWSGLEPLAGEYKFHYYAQRGCGESTRPFDRFESKNYYENMQSLDQTLGMGAQLADIERIRKILGEDKLILIGHSYGGFMASLYAAEFPEYVQAMILIAPANMLTMPQEEPGLFEAVRDRLPVELHPEFDDFLEEFLNYKDIFSKSEADLIALNQEFSKYYLMATDASPPEGSQPGGWMVPAIYMSIGLRYDHRPALVDISAPVLVIHGALDLQTEAASRAYTDAFPNARFQVIQDAAHFPFSEQPEEFARVVYKFLNEVK